MVLSVMCLGYIYGLYDGCRRFEGRGCVGWLCKQLV